MRRALHILLLCLLLSQGTAHAQSSWDKVLDRYELICSQCIEMRQKISRGESVPTKSVTNLLQELSSLRSSLSESSKSMTASQRKRFEAIKAAYSSAVGNTSSSRSNSAALPKSEAKRKATSGSSSMMHEYEAVPASSNDVAIVERTSVLIERLDSLISAPLAVSPGRSSASHGLSLAKTTAHEESSDAIYQRRCANPSWSAGCLAVAEMSSQPSYGLMAFATGRKVGAYLMATSTFSSARTEYECTSDGYIPAASGSAGDFWGTGKSRSSSYKIIVGPMLNLPHRFSVFAGAGYGSTTVSWEDISGTWARVEDLSCNGVVFNAGVMKAFGRVSLCLSGVYFLGLSSFAPSFGIGIEF